MEKIAKNLITPCGMNCNICIAHLREKNVCPGCTDKPTKKTCLNCKIRNCKDRTGKYCFNCSNFPCEKLSHLDKRYREKYGSQKKVFSAVTIKSTINVFYSKQCKI
jgi:hypothetical protein